MTRTAPFFASPSGTVRSFLPTRMIAESKEPFAIEPTRFLHADRTVTLSQIVHLRAVSHE